MTENPQSPLVCIDCHRELAAEASALGCPGCGARYPVEGEIADFSRGAYYDRFDPERDELPAGHLQGLALEIDGSVRRIRDYYVPLIHQAVPGAKRILDAGCGNGVSVDTLRAAGFEAWGNDLSQLRKHQWVDRESRPYLVVASALELPFPDGWFDVVISSGVIEHIGVAETSPPHYSVAALPDQHELRVTYLRELARVVRPGGRVFLDCPHGAFPIDFWHGNAPGSARLHSTREPFLPSFREVRAIAREALGSAAVRPHSPRGRLQFMQSRGHLHGRLLAAPAALLFRIMQWPGFRWISGTAINPFLVVEIEKQGGPSPD